MGYYKVEKKYKKWLLYQSHQPCSFAIRELGRNWGLPAQPIHLRIPDALPGERRAKLQTCKADVCNKVMTHWSAYIFTTNLFLLISYIMICSCPNCRCQELSTWLKLLNSTHEMRNHISINHFSNSFFSFIIFPLILMWKKNK